MPAIQRAAARAAIICLSLSVATVAESSDGGEDYFYRYFKTRIPLTLDTARVAIGSAHDPDGLLKRYNLVLDDSTGVQWPELTIAAVPMANRDAATIEQLVHALAREKVGFASPVFRDARKGVIIVPPKVLVGLRGGSTADEAAALFADYGLQVETPQFGGMHDVYRLSTATRDGFEALATANALGEEPGVAFSEPDLLATAHRALQPDDPLFTDAWGLLNTGQNGGTPGIDIGATEAWDTTLGAATIPVVVLDDGVQLDHPDLNTLGGADFVGSGVGGPQTECDNHGTLVAGCVSGIANNGIGAAGVSPDTPVISARYVIANQPCDGTGIFSASALVEALEYAAAQGARITVNSNAFTPLGTVAQKYRQTRDQGILHFASAGNEAASTVTFPASLDAVWAVTAVDRDGTLAAFSNFGPLTTIAAPGVAIPTTDRTGADGRDVGDYFTLNGTSFAAPYAAGVAALILADDPGLSLASVESALRHTATDLGAPGFDPQFGWGMVHAARGLSPSSPERIYVKSDANGADNGTSWADAFGDLQMALDAAGGTNAAVEIWVARGVYIPSRRTSGGDPRSAAFVLPPGARLYGGFAGDELLRGQRDPQANLTVLTGDRLGDDGDDFASTQENSYHVVIADGLTTAARLDGFVIEGGNANVPSHLRGGGVRMQAGWMPIDNCVIRRNQAEQGAGLYVDGDVAPRLVGTRLVGNRAELDGGGLAAIGASITLQDSELETNVAARGGGAFVVDGFLRLENSACTANAALSDRGGALALVDSVSSLRDVTLADNNAGSGGAIYRQGGVLDIVQCRLLGNGAVAGDGGAVYTDGGILRVVQCKLKRNSGTRGGAIFDNQGQVTLANVSLSHGSAATGAGVYLGMSEFANIVNTTFYANVASDTAGGLFNEGATPSVNNCLLWANVDAEGDGRRAQLAATPGSAINLNFSCVQGLDGAFGGVRNTAEDPKLTNPLGLDGQPGTLDDDLRPGASAACVDSASNLLVPADIFDLDDDGNTNEKLPVDLHGGTRFADSPCAIDRPVGEGVPADSGAFEAAPPTFFTSRIYVDGSATGARDGTSWQDAFTSLQTALCTAASNPGIVEEIWVAQGVYTPDRPGGSRGASFMIVEDVAVYGGFSGSEVALAQRDPAAFETILSGDLNGDDGPGFTNRNDNVRHVVAALSVNSTALVDGFIIRGGQADGTVNEGRGGAVFMQAADATFRNCTLRDNFANLGGAVYAFSGAPRFRKCTFEANQALSGGGAVYYSGADAARFIESRFIHNQCGGSGGGVYNAGSNQTLIANCMFAGNTTSNAGGGLFNEGNNQPILVNSVFTGNNALDAGALASGASGFSEPLIANCVFYANNAERDTGGVRSQGGNMQISNSILWANTDAGGAGQQAQLATAGGFLFIGYSTVQDWTGSLGGFGNNGVNPRFVDPNGADNTIGTGDDDLRLQAGSPLIDSGDNFAVPADVGDLDRDGNVSERTPLDLGLLPRFSDDPDVADTGSGTAPLVDRGAHETQFVCNAPQIITQPTGQTGCIGGLAAFSVEVFGTEPLSFQWRRNGLPISGATSATLVLVDLSIADTGAYDVVVTNECGSATSNAAPLTISEGPTILEPPQSGDFCADETVSLQVTASGPPPLTYQWRRNGTQLPGATGTTLVLSNVEATDSGVYDVIVSNDCGPVISAGATISVTEPPIITLQPTSRTVCGGTSVTFTTSASGGLPLTYQWQKDGVNLPGANQPGLTIDDVDVDDAGVYRAVVGNSCGAAVSAGATLQITPAVRITDQPDDAVTCTGEGVSFSVTATGAGVLTYQWQKDGEAIPGASTSTYTIDDPVTADAGGYRCIVTNECGTVASAVATLTIGEPAEITSQPTGATACAGDTVVLTVDVTGSPPPDVQWRRNSVPIPGATGTTLTLAEISVEQAGTYTAAVSNACATVVSSLAVVEVLEPAQIISGPAATTRCVGQSVTFSVIAAGTAPLQYQWRRNGAPISGATQRTYTINSVGTSNAADYSVVVTNDCGAVISANARLTVNTPPTITQQPQDVTQCAGLPVVFSVQASGGSASFQWRKGGMPIEGATAAAYQIDAASPDDAGLYDVIVSNSCGNVTSAGAELTVNDALEITHQPADQTACVGDSVTLTVTASGTAPLSYQWQRNDVNVPGATTATLTINGITTEQAGVYRVTVSNTCGSLTSRAAAVAVLTPPAIVSQPQDAELCVGGSTTLSVVASGSGPLAYQWRRNGIALTGETDSTLALFNADAGDAGTYSVRVSNDCGAVVSGTAQVTVNTGPSITSQPSDRNACLGAPFTLSVSATGSGPLTYRWTRNGISVPGANTAHLTIPSADANDAGSYQVTVTDACDSVVSEPAEVTVSVCRPTWYVDSTAADGGDGQSWQSAFNSLQAALDAAEPGHDVWVAAGVYHPTARTSIFDARSATFMLANDVRILGGFAGNEVAPEPRDPRANRTVLSGDLGAAGVISDNTYHVITGLGTDRSAILDGFVITGGNADEALPDNRGGGIALEGGAATIRSCEIRENNSVATGAGLYVGNADPLLVSNRFIDNQAGVGGAAYFYRSAADVVSCLFAGNVAQSVGGATYNSLGDPLYVNCVFTGNQAATAGGMFNNSSDAVLTNCSIVYNTASNAVGGVSNVSTSRPVIGNTVLFGNTAAGAGGEAAQLSGGTPLVTYSCIQGLSSFAGAGNIGLPPEFADADGPDNVLGTADDDLTPSLVSPLIDAGDNTLVPIDIADLDANGNITEPTPLDFYGAQRFVDVVTTPDSGVGPAPIVDIGAVEFNLDVEPCLEDLSGDGEINNVDLGILLSDYLAGPGGDLTGDGQTDFADLGMLLAAYLSECE